VGEFRGEGDVGDGNVVEDEVELSSSSNEVLSD